MQTYKFKTNINCGGCKSAVAPFLNAVEGIKHWDVNTEDVDKILTVQAENISADEIISTVKEAGYTADKVDEI